MLPRAQRLTTTQFDRAFAQSQMVRHPLVNLKAHFRGDGEETVRAAFVVPKKQAKLANKRNRNRRRLRERYRLHEAKSGANLSGYDLIFLTTAATHEATNEQLDAAIANVLGRVRPRQPQIEAPQAVISEDVPQQKLLPLTFLVLSAIRFYQRFISPGLPPSCRFVPSCSRYTYTSIERFGLWYGGILGVKRLCRCHPWHEGGDDPVPQFFPEKTRKNEKMFSQRR